MATKKAKKKSVRKREPRTWVVVLQKVGGKVVVQPDWRHAMKVGDRVRFIATEGKAHIEFRPAMGVDKNGRSLSNRFPCGTKNKEISDNAKTFDITESVKGVMQCTIVKGNLTIGYEQREAAFKSAKRLGQKAPKFDEDTGGTKYCTGAPVGVKCP